jgi:hypothetical protein
MDNVSQNNFTVNNHFLVRQVRMESALAGYRIQPPPYGINCHYLDGLFIRMYKFITGLSGDHFCKACIYVGMLYLAYLVMQAIQFWWGVKP